MITSSDKYYIKCVSIIYKNMELNCFDGHCRINVISETNSSSPPDTGVSTQVLVDLGRPGYVEHAYYPRCMLQHVLRFGS